MFTPAVGIASHQLPPGVWVCIPPEQCVTITCMVTSIDNLGGKQNCDQFYPGCPQSSQWPGHWHCNAKLCSREPGWRKPQIGSHQFPEDEWRCGTDSSIDIDNPIKASWGLSVHDGRLNERQLKTKRLFWTSFTAWKGERFFKESFFMMRWSSLSYHYP